MLNFSERKNENHKSFSRYLRKKISPLASEKLFSRGKLKADLVPVIKQR